MALADYAYGGKKVILPLIIFIFVTGLERALNDSPAIAQRLVSI